MRCLVLALILAACSVAIRSLAADDFSAQCETALERLTPLAPDFRRRIVDGNVTEATAKVLAAFPEESRNEAEAYTLGNLLFDIDANASYALHKAAALPKTEHSLVLWEWAIEQHRAKEYQGALDSYLAFSRLQPHSASTYALQADCLLRLNRVDEAIDAWKNSEHAKTGSIEQMENLVCATHLAPGNLQRREKLLAKALSEHDADAAADLVALDCRFPQDWWHNGPQKDFLAHDVPAVLTSLNLPENDLARRGIACAAECAIGLDEAGEVCAALKKHNLIVDDSHTIPKHAGVARSILEAARASNAVDEPTLREWLGGRFLEQARQSHNADFWHMAVGFGPTDPVGSAKLEHEAWRDSGDALFACGFLVAKNAIQPLTLDDADLTAAHQQFPDNGEIMHVVCVVAKAEKRLTRQLLSQAAQAELNQFSSFIAPASVVLRPRSDYVRSYFGELARMPNGRQD